MNIENFKMYQYDKSKPGDIIATATCKYRRKEFNIIIRVPEQKYVDIYAEHELVIIYQFELSYKKEFRQIFLNLQGDISDEDKIYQLILENVDVAIEQYYKYKKGELK